MNEKKKILIVEDEGLIAIDMKARLERVGYSVVSIVDTMEDALTSTEQNQPDLVLMDIRIKGEHDGIETAARIRKQFDIPVIFATAHADMPTLERAKLTEPFGYIVKPVINIDFRTQVETVLWKHAMERKLRISEAWLNTTLRNVADAVIATNTQGNIVFMNPPAAKLTGWEWEEAREKPLLEIFPIFDEHTGKPAVTPLESIYESQALDTAPKVFRLEGRGVPPTLIEARTSANLEGGQLLGIIIVFHDVTDRLTAEEQFRQIQKMRALSSLAEGLSRDLTERLQVIQLSIAGVRAQVPDSAEETLRHADRACTRAQGFVTQLAALAKSEPGPVQLLDLNRVIQDLSPGLQRRLGNARELQLCLGPDLPLIQAEQDAMIQVISSLAAEAREAMPTGGVLQIKTETIEPLSLHDVLAVRMTVHDSGKSIQSKAMDLAFDPYSQRRPGTHDAGLSMTLVYHWVALSGGAVEVNSASGWGTAFVMTFPAAAHTGIDTGANVFTAAAP